MNKTVGAMIVTAIVVAGCAAGRDQLRFDGEYFRTKVARVDGQRDVFTVRVRDVARSLDGAREAGRHAGISHCVENYGSSKIAWQVGPDTPPEALQIEDNTLLFQGVCPQV